MLNRGQYFGSISPILWLLHTELLLFEPSLCDADIRVLFSQWCKVGFSAAQKELCVHLLPRIPHLGRKNANEPLDQRRAPKTRRARLCFTPEKLKQLTTREYISGCFLRKDGDKSQLKLKWVSRHQTVRFRKLEDKPHLITILHHDE